MEDLYEVLQVSPHADTETISRIFRHLAKRFHPDNPESGDAHRFDLLAKAHRTLTDPEKRAAYDARHQEHWSSRWKLVGDVNDANGFGEDRRIRERLLSLLYVQRRRDMRNPGLGEVEMSRLISCPVEFTEFHLWYLREKGWVLRLESGQFAITALGVDQVEREKIQVNVDHLLEPHDPRGEGRAGTPVHRIDAASHTGPPSPAKP
jgi:curved DNA-binding protein CbpA